MTVCSILFIVNSKFKYMIFPGHTYLITINEHTQIEVDGESILKLIEREYELIHANKEGEDN